MVILGNRQYCLAKAAVAEREEIYIPLEDLHRLLAPELTYELDDSWAWIHLKGAYPVQAKLRDIQGIPGVGIVRLLCKTYGMQACRNGEILVIRLDGTCPEPGAWKLRQMQWLLEERQVGNLFHTEWFPEAGRLNSYRLYVPCGWEHQIRKPMLVYLHGAGGNEDSGFDRSRGDLSFFAEKYGYLVFAPNSYVHRSNYGGGVPPSGLFPVPLYEDAQGKKQYYSPEELEENALAQSCLCSLLGQVIEKWKVDRERIFLMGNSMGGIGTFHLGLELSGSFRGLIPCGAIPEPALVDWKAYGTKPILYIAGTEDHNGYEQMVRDYTYILAQGVSIRMLTVGGGAHSDAWVRVLPEVFQFCEAVMGTKNSNTRGV